MFGSIIVGVLTVVVIYWTASLKAKAILHRPPPFLWIALFSPFLLAWIIVRYCHPVWTIVGGTIAAITAFVIYSRK